MVDLTARTGWPARAIGTSRTWAAVIMVGLLVAASSCGRAATDDDGAATSEPPAETSIDDADPPDDGTGTEGTDTEGTAAPDAESAALDDSDVDPRFCTSFRRFWNIRAGIYGPPFDESPAEIEAMMAEAHALIAEWKRLAPDEIRPVIEYLSDGFTDPIDTLTEELGWDPLAAMNHPEGLAIVTDAELNAAGEELNAYMDRVCPVDEDLATPTDSLILDGRTIAVYNGTPQLNEAIAWGVGRYELAGLDVPAIGSVTFTMQSAMCDEIRARYLPTERGVELEMCMDEGNTCWEDPDADPDGCAGHCPAHLPGILAVVLHEIGHAWLDANMDTVNVEGFLQHVGLESWRNRDLPWIENGVEHAADTIAWGLMDRDIEMLRIGQPSAEELTAGFRILTGGEPLAKTD